REMKVIVGLNIDRNCSIQLGTRREIAGSDSGSRQVVQRVAHRADGEMRLVGSGCKARGDRVKPRLQRPKASDELRRVDAGRRKAADDVVDVMIVLESR